MGVDNLETRTAAGQRQTKRARVLLAARLKTPFGEMDCRLRDLSRSGALIECKPVPPVGSDVVFVRGTIAIPARVAWAGTDRIGIEFNYMIDESEVMVHVGRGPAAGAVPVSQAHVFRKPAYAKPLTGRELEMARQWGVQVGISLPEDR